MIFNKIKFLISSFIIIIFFSTSSLSDNKQIVDYGLISLMYHRFEENKYPSTNIRMSQFLSHISFIEDNNLKFINPKKFLEEIKNNKEQRKVLLTIDDGFSSFYISAWPILKKKKIPFILFISTREVGKNGYMTWDQIREIQSYKFTEIGNHSHSHEYLIDFDNVNIRKDIETSIKLFKKELGQNSDFFSYPFGEYSIQLKNIIIDFDFKFALGQHSGVIDETKDSFELPRFPINEKYGEMKRFKSLMKTLPFKYKKITPEQKYINNKTNPPDVNIEFFDDINLDRINCFSNEGNKWKNSSISFINPNKIKINLKEKFTTERGRINCSLRESDGFYRWLGIQFVVAEK